MRKPDFFIAGAPKCGTSAMHNYLRQHPDIYMPHVEIHFFGSDLDPRPTWWYPRPTEKEYLALFSEARDERRVGEKSPVYLYSERAAAEIKAFSPSASIIIMLRNPVDMMYSLHNELLYDGYEEISDFAEALAAETDRKRGLPDAANWDGFGGHIYKGLARYNAQLQRYFDVFGRENVHVIIYDDFKGDTPGVYRDTLTFLRVDENFEPEFRMINISKRARSLFLRNPPPFTRKLAKALMPKSIRRNVWRGVSRINTIFEQRRPMNPELRRQLQAEFAPEVQQISKLLDRDLAHWLE